MIVYRITVHNGAETRRMFYRTTREAIRGAKITQAAERFVGSDGKVVPGRVVQVAVDKCELASGKAGLVAALNGDMVLERLW